MAFTTGSLLIFLGIAGMCVTILVYLMNRKRFLAYEENAGGDPLLSSAEDSHEDKGDEEIPLLHIKESDELSPSEKKIESTVLLSDEGGPSPKPSQEVAKTETILLEEDDR